MAITKSGGGDGTFRILEKSPDVADGLRMRGSEARRRRGRPMVCHGFRAVFAPREPRWARPRTGAALDRARRPRAVISNNISNDPGTAPVVCGPARKAPLDGTPA